MILTIPFPDIDPVIFEIGPFAIRWYSLAYIVGLVVGWRYCRRLTDRSPAALTPEIFDDFLKRWEVVIELEAGEHIPLDTSQSITANLERLREHLPIWPDGL